MHLELQSSKSEKRMCQAHGLLKSNPFQKIYFHLLLVIFMFP